MRLAGLPGAALVFLCLAAACGGGRPPGTAPPAGPEGGAAAETWFTDVTAEAGVTFVHDSGATPRRYLPETMGSGAAVFDADGDGWNDLFLVASGPVAPGARPPSPGALYRNLGGGRFEDVTAGSGLDEAFLGMGAAVGDVDNDGDDDLFVSGIGGDRLFVNRGDGRFREEGAERGLLHPGFGTSAAFLDYDRDGWLDLFVGRYVTWSPETDQACSPDGEHRSYCTPEVYSGAASVLYRNQGGGRFEDVTRPAGLDLPGKTLGVVPLDYDRDGWPDLAVANDTARNFLFENCRDGTFREVGEEAGMAFSESGAPRGGMGIDAADLDGDGLSDLVVGNFSQEMSALFQARAPGVYRDTAAQVGIGLPTLLTLAFGTLAADFDGDGWPDILLANGHIEPEIQRFQPLTSYAQPLQLFRNLGGGRGFELVPEPEGSALAGPWVARGLAAADLDGDGDLDLLLTQNGASARLLRNDRASGSWLRLALRGRRSNPNAYGAAITAVRGERVLQRTLVSGRSYLSASEPLLTLGLGDLPHLDRLEIRWPSGQRQTLQNPPLNRLLTLQEPSG